MDLDNGTKARQRASEWLLSAGLRPTRTVRVGAPDSGYPILGDAPGSYVFQA